MRDVVRQVRLGFCAALLPRGAVWGLAAALVPCAVLLFVSRWLQRPLPSVALLVLLAVGVLVGLLVAARGVPSRKSCRALADDVTHAGGLILVADCPGADLWPRPATADVPLPPRRLKRPALALASAAVAGLLAATVPLQLMDAAEAEIERLAEEAELSAEELEEVRAEVQRIVEAAPNAGAADTLDAFNRVADRLRYGEALAQDAARRASEPRTAQLTAAESAALQQELSEMLANSPSGEGEGEGQGQGEGQGEGEGVGPGSGGANRGRADAIISWTDPVGLGDSKLKDISREADPTKDESTRIGEALDEWDPATAPAARGTGTGLAAPRATGAGSAVQRILPRHRDAVRRYFSTERNEP